MGCTWFGVWGWPGVWGCWYIGDKGFSTELIGDAGFELGFVIVMGTKWGALGTGVVSVLKSKTNVSVCKK